MGMLDAFVGIGAAADSADLDVPPGTDGEDHAPAAAGLRPVELAGFLEKQVAAEDRGLSVSA